LPPVLLPCAASCSTLGSRLDVDRCHCRSSASHHASCCYSHMLGFYYLHPHQANASPLVLRPFAAYSTLGSRLRFEHCRGRYFASRQASYCYPHLLGEFCYLHLHPVQSSPRVLLLCAASWRASEEPQRSGRGFGHFACSSG
jgi:hypothetical protein